MHEAITKNTPFEVENMLPMVSGFAFKIHSDDVSFLLNRFTDGRIAVRHQTEDEIHSGFNLCGPHMRLPNFDMLPAALVSFLLANLRLVLDACFSLSNHEVFEIVARFQQLHADYVGRSEEGVPDILSNLFA
jgi:hypothetical protein